MPHAKKYIDGSLSNFFDEEDNEEEEESNEDLSLQQAQGIARR
jgi:hypothetical protein